MSYAKQLRSRSLTPLCRKTFVSSLESVAPGDMFFISLGGPKAHESLGGIRMTLPICRYPVAGLQRPWEVQRPSDGPKWLLS